MVKSSRIPIPSSPFPFTNSRVIPVTLREWGYPTILPVTKSLSDLKDHIFFC
jgi:hypothetical protein